MLRLALAVVLAATPAMTPPVDGPVKRGFDAPASPYGPGHRGIDYDVPAGTAVDAAADGVVSFAGRVGDALHVVVAHTGHLRTSYSYLAQTRVRPGQRVLRGQVVGVSGGTGPGHGPGVLHFGLREGRRYVDPRPLLETRPVRIRLAPLDATAQTTPCR